MPWLPEKLISETNSKTYLRTKKNLLIYLSLCTAGPNTNYPTRQESNLVHDANWWGTVRTVDILPLSYGDVYVFDIIFLAFVSAKQKWKIIGTCTINLFVETMFARSVFTWKFFENWLKSLIS